MSPSDYVWGLAEDDRKTMINWMSFSCSSFENNFGGNKKGINHFKSMIEKVSDRKADDSAKTNTESDWGENGSFGKFPTKANKEHSIGKDIAGNEKIVKEIKTIITNTLNDDKRKRKITII
jgi:hypothetical protein